MMSPKTILVTGAAGGVGSTADTAIGSLLEDGHRVRAMVRTLDARADTLRDMGAEVVVADMLDIIAVRAGMRGCSVVYFTMSILPTYFEAAANVAVTRTLPDAIASDAINYGLRRQRRERQRSAGRVVQVRLVGGTAPDGARVMFGPAAR